MIMVTGATGFVGKALINRLVNERSGREIIAAVRRPIAGQEMHSSVKYEVVGSLDGDNDWSNALLGVATVVHCAARVHIMNDTASDRLAEYRRVNVQGTLNLAEHAAKSGVKRFVFLSSIKVNGESTVPGRPFQADTPPQPSDPYGIAKLEAEIGLFRLAKQTGMEIVVIRPPLVYGPGVKANFAAMMRAVAKGLPLPFGAATQNRRSFVALDNLVDLIITCVDHPAAANQTFLVSDDEDLSTAELLRRQAKAFDRAPILIPVPTQLIQLAAKLIGKGDVAQRLLGSLQVDIFKTKQLLNWTPPITVDEGLLRSAQGLLR